MAKMNIRGLCPSLGSSERIFLGHMNDLNDFYLHSSWAHGKLREYDEQLAEAYSKSSTESATNDEEFNVGDYCGYQSDDGVWYRGLIRELDSNGNAMVLKIDYGDEQCIPVQFLRSLQTWMFESPCLALHCSLAGLSKPTNGWSSEVIGRFCSRLKTPFLYAKFIKYNETTNVFEVEIIEQRSKALLNKEFQEDQIEQSTTQINDDLLYAHIQIEKLNSIKLNHINLLHYENPSKFYVNLREKCNNYYRITNGIKNFQPVKSLSKYDVVAAKDIFGVWVRGIVIEINNHSAEVEVFYIDIGQKEIIPIENILGLPEEFQSQPAFAIPCFLNGIYPINDSTWKSNDPVHDEFRRMTSGDIICMVNSNDRTRYDIKISIFDVDVDDLRSYLIEKKLVSCRRINH